MGHITKPKQQKNSLSKIKASCHEKLDFSWSDGVVFPEHTNF